MREVIEKDVKNINIKKIDCSFFWFPSSKNVEAHFLIREMPRCW